MLRRLEFPLLTKSPILKKKHDFKHENKRDNKHDNKHDDKHDNKRDNKHDSSFCSRDLISVDDDYVAEHEAKILKEADLQEKILEAVEKLRQQIRQLKNEEEGDHLPVSYI